MILITSTATTTIIITIISIIRNLYIMLQKPVLFALLMALISAVRATITNEIIIPKRLRGFVRHSLTANDEKSYMISSNIKGISSANMRIASHKGDDDDDEDYEDDGGDDDDKKVIEMQFNCN